MSVVYTTPAGGGVFIVSLSVVALYVQRGSMVTIEVTCWPLSCHLLWQHTDQHAALIFFQIKCVVTLNQSASFLSGVICVEAELRDLLFLPALI